jgi:hypothetical protein
MFKLDRTAFSVKNIREQHLQRSYWLETSPDERLAAAGFLIAQAWGYASGNPPKMDKTVFSMRKHGEHPER